MVNHGRSMLVLIFHIQITPCLSIIYGYPHFQSSCQKLIELGQAARPLLSCCTKALKENTTLQNLGVASTELGQTLGGTDGMGWDGLVVPGFHSNTADPLLQSLFFLSHGHNWGSIGVIQAYSL